MEFEIPASLDGLDLEALAQLESDTVVAFDAVRDDPNLNADGLARLRELAGFVRSVRTQQQQIVQVASELDDLDAAVHGDPDAEEPTDGADGAGGQPAAPDDTATEAGEGGDPTGDSGGGPTSEAPPAKPAVEPAPVVASLARRAARRQPKPGCRVPGAGCRVPGAGRSAVVKAAAEVPNVPHGHQFPVGGGPGRCDRRQVRRVPADGRCGGDPDQAGGGPGGAADR